MGHGLIELVEREGGLIGRFRHAGVLFVVLSCVTAFCWVSGGTTWTRQFVSRVCHSPFFVPCIHIYGS